MNLLSYIYIPIPIRTGDFWSSALPPYASGILIAAFGVLLVALICLGLSITFDVFDHKDFSEPFFKAFPILMTLCILLIGIALLCALIGV